MLTASEVTDFFSQYLASNARKGALLISGDWGSGKTHLALNHLSPLAKGQGFNSVYLSIADIQTLEEFERKLFLASYRFLNKKTPNRLANVAIGAAGSWLSRYGLSIADLISAESALDSKTLIFIDDIERAEAAFRKRVLYRLAGLSETKNAKIVILADEKKIGTSADDYALIKEKTICRTIEFQPTYEEIASTAVNVAFSSPPGHLGAATHWAIEKKIAKNELTGILSETIKQGECRNLRTAISAIVDVCELVDQFNATPISIEEVTLRRLIHSTLSLVIEIKSDKENLAKLRKYSGIETSIPWIHLLNSNDPSKEYLLSFERRYVDSTDLHFLRSPALIDYLESGACNVKKIHADILNFSPDETSAHAYVRLGKYRSTAKHVFDELAAQAISELKDLKIRSLHAITECAQTLFYLSEKNLFPSTPIELRLLFTETLEKLTQEYLNGAEDIFPDFDPTLLWNQKDGELKVVILAAQAAASKLENARFNRLKKAELSKLETDPSSFVASLISTESKIAHQACLKPDDAELITEIFIRLIQQDGIPHHAVYQVGRAISNRYSDNGFGKAFHEEIAFLELFNKLLTELKPSPNDQLLRDSILSLRESISKAIALLKGQK